MANNSRQSDFVFLNMWMNLMLQCYFVLFNNWAHLIFFHIHFNELSLKVCGFLALEKKYQHPLHPRRH